MQIPFPLSTYSHVHLQVGFEDIMVAKPAHFQWENLLHGGLQIVRGEVPAR